MKKIIVLVTVLVASSTATFAFNPSDYNAFYKLNNKATFTGLVGYIDADKAQANYLEHVFKVTANELKTATQKESDVVATNVVNYNFKNAKSILSEEQYKKYLEFINLYLTNETNSTLVSENN